MHVPDLAMVGSTVNVQGSGMPDSHLTLAVTAAGNNLTHSAISVSSTHNSICWLNEGTPHTVSFNHVNLLRYNLTADGLGHRCFLYRRVGVFVCVWLCVAVCV